MLVKACVGFVLSLIALATCLGRDLDGAAVLMGAWVSA
jgi:hypothetical protein